jgi:hypothetical protein
LLHDQSAEKLGKEGRYHNIIKSVSLFMYTKWGKTNSIPTKARKETRLKMGILPKVICSMQNPSKSQ